MYVTTFYSFKGGVGRTMALLNCATELAQRGRRVLLVDFDLEAPGIPTFEGFSEAKRIPGIVDYIRDYLTTGIAPAVEKYVFRSEVFDAAGGSIWLMPAGKQDAAYSAKLHSIDWQKLYEEQSGFLLFEDLKAQWKETIAPDYVLIDSRTGHTDVGGICTRQLPDAICIMFFPNEQNLVGLSTLLADVRSEAEPPRSKIIDLHFVPSNVPNLDDEEGILKDRISRFQETLKYDQPSATIHHYNSLGLLRQTIFTKHRPSSQLAREYQQLTSAVVARNLNDRDAAIGALKEVRAAFGRSGRELNDTDQDIEEKLEKIGQAHSEDGEIQYQMGIVRMTMRQFAEAQTLLSNAIRLGNNLPPVYINRALCYRAVRDDQSALADISVALHDEKLSERDLIFVNRRLLDLEPSAAYQVEQSPALDRLTPNAKVQLAWDMMRSREALLSALRILRSTQQSAPVSERDRLRNVLILALIASHQYKEAISEINRIDAPDDDWTKAVNTFNYAIAVWGESGIIPMNIFQEVANLGRTPLRGTGANYHQCMALTFWVVGDEALAREHLDHSRRALRANPKSEFSCWRYLLVSPLEFDADLLKLEGLLDRQAVQPEFMTEPTELELPLPHLVN